MKQWQRPENTHPGRGNRPAAEAARGAWWWRGPAAAAVLALAALGGSACSSQYKVGDGQLLRSAQPLRHELEERIEREGIKTVLRLRGGNEDEFWYEQTATACRNKGVTLVQIPMSDRRFPHKWELLQLVDAIEFAEYPMLVHCKAGADRTGLASAIYVLHTGGTLAQARKELALLPYGHTGIGGNQRMDEVLDYFAPWEGVISFNQWARDIYEAPEGGTLRAGWEREVRQQVAAYRDQQPIPVLNESASAD